VNLAAVMFLLGLGVGAGFGHIWQIVIDLFDIYTAERERDDDPRKENR
jgi:hypothetical protein